MRSRKSCQWKGFLAALLCGIVLCGCAKEEEPVTDREAHESAVKESIVPESIAADSVKESEAVENSSVDYEELFKGIEVIMPYKSVIDNNPIITQRFGADPYAMVYGDKTYFYMTGDAFEYDKDGNVVENTYGQINTINVVSTADMVNFEDHGAIRAAGEEGAAKWARNSWAPAAAWKNIDGKDTFFLYFANSGGGIGVLTSDSPTGPFVDPLGEALISRNTPNCADVLWLFDPAVLVDDDGRAYLYFGGGVPEGRVSDPGTARVVELGADMISIVGEPVRIDVPYLFEDSGIHKYNNKYYYTYCSNWQVDQEGTDKYGFHSAEIVSMESESPMGPFTIKETILENPGKYFGLYGNNHHCVFSFKDKWYITYHTRVLEQKMGIEKGYRCTHIDEFTIQEDGSIGLIKQTLQGREQVAYVDAYEDNNATKVAVMSGLDTVATGENVGAMALSDIQSGAFVKVQGVDFGSKAPTKWLADIQSVSNEQGVIQLRADRLYGEIIGYLSVEGTGNCYEELVADLETDITGVHDIYMIFYGEGYHVASWRFE